MARLETPPSRFPTIAKKPRPDMNRAFKELNAEVKYRSLKTAQETGNLRRPKTHKQRGEKGEGGSGSGGVKKCLMCQLEASHFSEC